MAGRDGLSSCCLLSQWMQVEKAPWRVVGLLVVGWSEVGWMSGGR